MNLNRIFILARKNIGKGQMASSARTCLQDAERLREDGEMYDAARRALKSLAYSVGILHSDYKEAWVSSGFEGEPRLVG